MKREKEMAKRAKAEKLCRELLGFVPTEEQWLDAYALEPGAVKLFLCVVDSQYWNRIKFKDKY